MNLVSIDFVAGSHGNFLEYVCNRHIAGLLLNDAPFTDLGASHKKDQKYYNQAIFRAMHYSERNIALEPNVIRIIFDQDDLLTLSSVSLLRAGDTGIDNDCLEFDTFHKLDNSYYRGLIDELNSSYPDHAISSTRPDCPRYVLREFFKFGFRETGTHGFFRKLKEITNSDAINVFDFQFKAFYNKQLFLKVMQDLSNWYGNQITDFSGLERLHAEFLSKNPYITHKPIGDQIITAVIQNRNVEIPNLTLFQESYINGVLEQLNPGLEMPFVQYDYFKNTKDIVEYILCSE